MKNILIWILSICSPLFLFAILLNINWDYPFFLKGIIFCISIFFINFFFLFSIKKKINFDIFKILLASILSLFINYSIHVTILIHLERAFSVFLIYEMSATKKWYSKEDLKKLSYQNYFSNKHIEKRLTEQILINNIEKNGDIYSITEKGIIMKELFLYISRIYNINTNSLIKQD